MLTLAALAAAPLATVKLAAAVTVITEARRFSVKIKACSVAILRCNGEVILLGAACAIFFSMFHL